MRKHYIDNLKWMIILVLIPYHAGMAFNAWGEPNYIMLDSDKLISSFLVFFSPWFMPLLFLLAGTNTSYSIQKRGTTTYLKDRTKRNRRFIRIRWLLFCGTLLVFNLSLHYFNNWIAAYKNNRQSSYEDCLCKFIYNFCAVDSTAFYQRYSFNWW